MLPDKELSALLHTIKSDQVERKAGREPRRARQPLSTREILLAGVCRFLGAALFGLFISFVIFIIVVRCGFTDFWAGGQHTLWLIPVTCGILGIFWFDDVLDLARKIFEGYFHVQD